VIETVEHSPIGMTRRIAVGLRQIGKLRTLLTIVALGIAVVVARMSWHIPLLIDAEHALFDARQVATAPMVEQDDRIVMVAYTDETLINTGKRSPLDRAILAKALRRIDAMGAKAIGIDILIDQPQPDDPIVIDAFKSMKTPTFLAYASATSAQDKILLVQQQFIENFDKTISKGNVHPTSIVIHSDDDNVLRRWAIIEPGDPPRIPNAMVPEAKAFQNYEGSVVYRQPKFVDRPIFASIPIDTFAEDALFDVPEAAALMRKQIEGRYVLIGGNIQDIDTFETPMSRTRTENKSTWGVEIFAHMIAQILDNRVLRPLSDSSIWLAAILVVIAGGLTATSNLRPWIAGAFLIVQLGLLGGLPFWFAAHDFDTYELPAFGWILAWFLGFAILSAAARALGSEQRKFAQSALGKYLPRDIATEILRDPDSLQLRGEKREIFALFTDLEGFTKLSHAIEPEMVATLLNRYLESLSDVVLEHGGTIDKFVGDAVVAFWGAPISRPDDGKRAVLAAMAMYKAGEDFRKSVPEGVPAIGKTRVGLHHGEAIVGNFGGEGRIQYTALGDSMNTAARLESANKQTKSSILISQEAAELSGLDIFRPLGKIVLRGRATPISVLEPVPDMDKEERKLFSDLANRAIRGDVSAITALTTQSANKPEDTAFANFIYRLNHQEKGGYFVLD
jgi:adenylate cyclase